MTREDRARLLDDPLLAEPLENLFARNNARPLPAREGPRQQPHGLLKKRCREALVRWGNANGARGVLIPVQNVRVETGKGAARKSFMTGRVGAGDDTWICRGVPFSIEYKHGADQQRDTQARFQERWEAAGGVYLIVRSPEQLIAGVEQALRDRGRR